jgi:hypothetical protein
MESEKKVHKGGYHSRFEPSKLREINASPFSKRCFRNDCCMKFCENIQEFGCHVPLTSLFAHNFNTDKAITAGIEFIVSTYIISSTTSILDHGETWFKGMELDLDDYKLFLKPNVRDAPKHVFPFRHLLDKYAPLMRQS